MSLIFKGLISVDLILVTLHVFKDGAWKCEVEWTAVSYKIFVRKFSDENARNANVTINSPNAIGRILQDKLFIQGRYFPIYIFWYARSFYNLSLYKTCNWKVYLDKSVLYKVQVARCCKSEAQCWWLSWRSRHLTYSFWPAGLPWCRHCGRFDVTANCLPDDVLTTV
jgi:hypothetical protein